MKTNNVQTNRRTLPLAGEELAEDQVATANENLILGLAKAHVWFEMMLNGEVRTVPKMAANVNVERFCLIRLEVASVGGNFGK